MGGGSTVNVPGPSEEERALQAEQTELLREQRDILGEQVRIQNLLSPFLFESAGVTPILDDAGEIIAFEGIDDPNQELIDQIETGLLERSAAALKGELPVSPTLEREIGITKRLTRERLRKQLGPGFETSSPGIEALSRQEQSATELREAARRGELTLAEQLSIQRGQSESQQSTALLNRIFGVQGLGQQVIGGLGNVIQGIQQGPLATLQAQRELETNAAISNAQARSSTLGSIFGAIGTIGGGIASGVFSSKGMKTDSSPAAPVLDALTRIPIEEWRYKGNETRHIGAYAEDFRDAFGFGDGLAIQIVDALGICMKAIQELTAEVRELKGRVDGR